jgi:predicted ArsR family transcriptional regulator
MQEVPASGDSNADGLDAVEGLADPVRRRCFRAVLASPEPLGKDDVARIAGIGRSLAAYHLDRLADASLLSVSYARRTGRSGPGAGRPAKLYARPRHEVRVQIPARDDALLARLLAAAIEAAGSPEARDALIAVARTEGERLAETATDESALLNVLATRGYEPCDAGDEIRLRNCPFHHLVDEHRDLVCGLNLALLDAAIERCPGYRAALEPRSAHCCVVVRRPVASDA